MNYALTIYTALGYFVRFVELVIIARCVLSWLPMGYNNPLTGFIYRLTEPLMAPIRNMLYRSPLGGAGMTLDISPVIVLLILNGIYSIVGQLLL